MSSDDGDPAGEATAKKPAKKPLRRRRLLLAGAATVAAGAAGVGAWQIRKNRPLPPARVSVDPNDAGFYRTLGRTGLKVSAIGIGAGSLERVDPILRAVDSGLNYIDTAVCYGDSELVIARALQARPGLRDKLIIASKWDPSANTSKAKILASLDNSLKRLGVDMIDIMQLHWLGGGHVPGDNGFNRLDNPELHEAMADAKASGKVRFFGATSHDKDRSAILQHAIDKGVYDMLLVKMNALDFGDADMPALLAKARKHNVGVVAMKSQPHGGELPPGFEQSKWNVYQANIKWCLQQSIDCVVQSRIGTDADAQDEAIIAAKSKLTRTEEALLQHYTSALSPQYCRGCDDICGAACPEQVAIAEVMQFRMYARQYGWPRYARQLYRALPAHEQWAERCSSCDECSVACSYGVDAAAGVRDAHKLLGDRFA